MCDFGISAAVTAIVGTIVSTTMSVVSNIKQSKATQAQYNYQAEVEKQNAKIANENAAQERQSGLEEARLQRMKTLQAIGSQQVAMGANNIDVTQGTALDTIEDTAQMGELDALMVQYNSERTAQNYEQTANNYLNQSNLDKMAAQNVKSVRGWNTAATIAGGLGDLGMTMSKTSWKKPATT